MRIVKEDPKLGISKVVWKFTEEAVHIPVEIDDVPCAVSVPLDQELSPVQPDHLADMRQQILFLQQVIENQNQQLHTKDELIRNFQVLLKSEQEQVLKLESRMGGTNWLESLKRKLKKQ